MTVTPSLYAWGNSPFAYKVVMAAAHRGVVLTARVAGLPDMTAAKKHTGLQKTPFVVDGDRWITDSTAICAWLDTRGSGPALRPADPAARAECLLLEDWADEALNRSAEPWIWVGDPARYPRMHGLSVAEQTTHLPSKLIFIAIKGWLRNKWKARLAMHGGPAATHKLLCSQLDLLENRLAGRAWFFGDSATVADFAVAAQLANLYRVGGHADVDARPALAALVKRAAAALPWWTSEGPGGAR